MKDETVVHAAQDKEKAADNICGSDGCDMSARYEACIEKLYSIAPSFQNVGSAAYHPGLKTMEDFAAVMGDPQKRFRSVHIAGTNGKGSTAHFMASALAFLHPGKRIGLYTSPHLVDFRERVRVISCDSVSDNTCEGGSECVQIEGRYFGCSKVEMISREDVVAFMDRYEWFIDERRPSFFEITTAMAFAHFAAVGVEIAVIETGLGGRLDSTNIILSDLSIITSVGLDHVNILGDTIEQIAREKAGIIKLGAPVVIGSLQPEAASVVRQVAESCASPLYDSTDVFEKLSAGEPVTIRSVGKCAEADCPECTVLPQGFTYDHSLFDLKSDSQKINFRTVVTALEVLGYDLCAHADEVMYALRNAARISGLRGRWERLGESPRVICDIGHNPEAMRISMAQLGREFMGNMSGKEGASNRENIGKPCRRPHLYMVYGMVADKDIATVADMLPADTTYIFTQPHGPRAMAAAELSEIVLASIRRRMAVEEDARGQVSEAASPDVTGGAEPQKDIAPKEHYVVPEPVDAYRLALHMASPDDLIFVGGSSFVVSEVLSHF